MTVDTLLQATMDASLMSQIWWDPFVSSSDPSNCFPINGWVVFGIVSSG